MSTIQTLIIGLVLGHISSWYTIVTLIFIIYFLTSEKLPAALAGYCGFSTLQELLGNFSSSAFYWLIEAISVQIPKEIPKENTKEIRRPEISPLSRRAKKIEPMEEKTAVEINTLTAPMLPPMSSVEPPVILTSSPSTIINSLSEVSTPPVLPVAPTTILRLRPA